MSKVHSKTAGPLHQKLVEASKATLSKMGYGDYQEPCSMKLYDGRRIFPDLYGCGR